MDDVAVPGEATQQIPNALDEGVDLWMNQYFSNQIFAGILNQSFTCELII